MLFISKSTITPPPSNPENKNKQNATSSKYETLKKQSYV